MATNSSTQSQNQSNIDNAISILRKNNNLIGPDGELTDDAVRYLPPSNSQQRYYDTEKPKQEEKKKEEISERLNLARGAAVTVDEIEKFRQRWYKILDGYSNDLESINFVNGFTPMRLAIARESLESLILLPNLLEKEIKELSEKVGVRFSKQIDDVYKEVLSIIQRLIKQAENILNEVTNDMQDEQQDKDKLNQQGTKIRKGFRRARRITYLTTSLPILLPILCICIAGLILLAAISSLTGGGPDQTQNMQALQEECREAGDCRTLLLNKIRERGVDNN